MMAPIATGRTVKVVSLLMVLALLIAARAQDGGEAPPPQPTTSPASQEALRKLQDMKRRVDEDEARKAAAAAQDGAQEDGAPQTQPGDEPPPAPDSTPEGQRNLDELRRRAAASTQEAAIAAPADDDFEGPPSYNSPRPLARRPRTPTPRDTPPQPADQPAVAQVPPATDGKTVWFNFEKMPWEDVVRFFARQIGKPILEDDALVIGGELTYVTNDRFTKDEAIDELNLIMQEKGFRFVEREHHIYIIPTSDLHQHVDLARIFPTVERFVEASPRDMDYVTVYVDVPKGQSAQKRIEIFGSSLPDYTRMAVVPETNRIKMSALARDVRKFLALTERIIVKPEDARETRVFNINTNANDIERMIREILGISSGAPIQRRVQRDPRTGQPVPEAQPPASADDTIITADERTNTLIVKATEDKIKEIEELIKIVDNKVDLEFTTVVTPVENANPTEVASLLNQIFQQEQGQSQPGWQRMQQMQNRRNQRQPNQPNQPQANAADPASLLGEGIFERAKKTVRIVPDERTRSIIVYANKDGHQRVRELLDQLDVPQPSNYQKFVLENAVAADIFETVSQIAANMRSTSTPGRPGGRAATVLLDDPSNALYVIADREDMENIQDVIDQLDVETPEDPRHVVVLKKLLPSDVAQRIAPLLDVSGGGGGGMAQQIRGRMGRNAPRAAASVGTRAQIVPLDEAQTLIVICSDQSWAKVEDLIRTWDENAVSNTPVLQRFEIVNGDAQSIANTVKTLYSNYQHPALGRQPVQAAAEGNTVFVQAIEPAMKEVAALMPQLDVESDVQTEVLTLVAADASQVAQQAQTMFGGGGGRNPRFGGGGGAPGVSIQADTPTNALIVRAEPKVLEEIRTFALEAEERAAGQKLERRFFTPRNAQLQDLANAISGMFAGGGGGGGRFGNAGAGGSRIKVITAGNQVIVEAPAEKIEEIAAYVDEFDQPIDIQKLVIETRKLPGVNVAALANQLGQAYARRPRADRLPISFNGDQALETLVITAPKDEIPQIDELLAQMTKDAEQFALETLWIDLKHANAGDIAEQVKQLLIARMSRYGQETARGVNVMPDLRGNRLNISVPKVGVDLVASIVEQYDREIAEDAGIQIFPLANAEPQEVLNVLNSQFAPRSGRPQPGRDPIFSISGQDLVVQAPSARMDEVATAIERLDAAAAVADAPPVMVELINADPDATAQAVRELFPARGGRGRPNPSDLSVLVSNKSLILKGPEDKIARARDLIDKIDEYDPNADLMVKVYHLKVMSATLASASVTGFLASSKSKPGGPTVGAFPEPSSNSLVVIAPKDKFAIIEGLIREIENLEDIQPVSRAYALKNADAEIASAGVEKLLGGKSKGGAAIPMSVQADPKTGRIIVVAPEDVQKEVAALVATIDDAESQQIREVIQLEAGDAVTVARALTDLMGGQAGKTQARVRFAPDPTSNSILVMGPPKDVAEVRAWIAEVQAGDGSQPQVRMFYPQNAGTTDIVEQLEAVFGEGRTPQDTVTVSEDVFSGRIMVTATARKMRQVETLIEQLDVAPPEDGGSGKVTHFVDVYRGKASDVEFELMDLLPAPENGGPEIDSDWSDTYLKVRCRPGEIDKIVALVRQVEARLPISRMTLVRNDRRDMRALLENLKANNPNINLVLPSEAPRPDDLEEYLRSEDEDPDALREGARPRRTGAKSKRTGKTSLRHPQVSEEEVFPFQATPGGTQALLAELEDEIEADRQRRPAPFVLVQSTTAPAEEPRAPRRIERPAPAPREIPPADRAAPAPAATDAQPPPAAGTTATPPVRAEREKVTITVDRSGRVIVVGPEGDVEDINDAIEQMLVDIEGGEVIKIFRFRYGDVNAAAQILDKMFNERQVIRIPQQNQQQNQPQGRNQQGQDGKEGQGGALDQLRNMAGGGADGNQGRNPRGRQPGGGAQQVAGGQRIRMATDPGHNRLIVKCPESDLPEIRQLLRELDIPPGEVELKVIQLKNLTARETSENLKEVLGIAQARNRRQNPFGAAGARGANQQQLMEMMQQQLVALPGGAEGEAARIDSTEIVPNEVTNSLLVSAPPEVMDIIEGVIIDLEELEGRDIVGVYNYELQLAKVDDIAPLLQEIYGGARGGGGGGGAARGGGRPGEMGPVSITGDPRSNTLIIAAQKKDIEKIWEQIERLDIKGPPSEAVTYTLKYGDATEIARVVQEIYVTNADPRTARGPSDRIAITPDPATNSIVVFASAAKREEIIAKITEHDEMSKQSFRQIDVAYADPEELADKLNGLFASGSAGGGAAPVIPGRRTRSPAATGGRVTIVGDKASQKLLVRAPDELFAQINEMVTTLDQPDEQLQVREFALEHASPTEVVESVKAAMLEYIQLLRFSDPDAKGLDAFTAIPDERTGRVIVVGSPKIFTFVAGLLPMIDQDTPDIHRKEFRVFALDKANAQTVAEAINNMAGSPAASSPRRPGMPGMPGMAPGATRSASQSLNVQAIAEPVSNSVMVFGKPTDIDRVEEQVIRRLEENVLALRQLATIPVENASPTQISSFIAQFLYEPTEGGRPGEAGGTSEAQIIPNENNSSLIVRGSTSQIAEVRRLVTEFDKPDMDYTGVRVIPLPFGQDAVSLASEVERVVNGGVEDLASATGRPARRITVGANEYTNSLLIYGDRSMFGTVENVVEQLAGVKPEAPVTSIIELKNLSPEDVEQLVEDLQGVRGGGSARPRRTSGSPAVRPSRSSRPAVQPPSGGGSRPGGTNRSGLNRAPAGGANRPRTPNVQPGGGANPPAPAPNPPRRSNRARGDSNPSPAQPGGGGR